MQAQKQPTQPTPHSESKLCSKCTKFWGSQIYEGMCSSCYKYLVAQASKQHPKQKNKQAVPPAPQQKTQKYQGQKKGQQADKSKCFKCNKKVGLLGTQCKCNYVFCNLHRMPEDHTCNYNYEAEGKDHLAKEIKKLEHKKLEHNDSL